MIPAATAIVRRAASRWLPLFAGLLLALIGLAACSEERAAPKDEATVDLERLTPLPARVYDQQADAVKMAVAAMLSPRGTVMSYRPLQGYLEHRLGRPVQLVQRRTYQEVNELLARNMVDLAFVCTGAFRVGLQQGIMDLLVVPRIDGRETYQALLITAADSPIRTLEDLQGKVFAFTDPLSNSGYLYPVSILRERGERLESFFGRTIFTYSHDRSIAAVVEGVADAASVDSIVFAHAVRRDLDLAAKLRVIQRSPEFGMPPVVTPAGVDSDLRRQLREILLHIHEDPAAVDVLTALGIERFVEPDLGLYR